MNIEEVQEEFCREFWRKDSPIVSVGVGQGNLRVGIDKDFPLFSILDKDFIYEGIPVVFYQTTKPIPYKMFDPKNQTKTVYL